MLTYVFTEVAMGKLLDSLAWLNEWGKQRWKNRRKEIPYKIGPDDFHPYHESTFLDCPNFSLGLFALLVLRPDIARKKSELIEICLGRLAKLADES